MTNTVGIAFKRQPSSDLRSGKDWKTSNVYSSSHHNQADNLLELSSTSSGIYEILQTKERFDVSVETAGMFLFKFYLVL